MQQTGFTKAVYQIVAAIPRGRVMTYGQIAQAAGRPHAARRVGQIMAGVPKDLCLPCHRVVRTDGILAPDHAFGSHHLQRDLLQQEGVPFTPAGRIDFVQLQRRRCSPP